MTLFSLTRFALALSGAVLSVSMAWGQDYPNKPVKIIVPIQAGSGTDQMMRYLADGLSQSLGQRFVVENRPGANGSIGMSAAAKAAPDGYTLVQGALGQNVLNQFLFSPLQYDPEKDFVPIVLIAKIPFLIAAHPDFPATSIAELVTVSKARSDKVNVAITSTTSLVLFEMLRRATGAQLVPVRYAGAATATPDVLNGLVPIYIEIVPSARALALSGRLKVLAITSQKMSELMPGIKSIAEQGIAGINEVAGWTGLFAPTGTPQAVINILNVETNKILSRPEARRRLLELGAEAAAGTQDELAAYVVSERAKWGEVVRSANIKAE